MRILQLLSILPLLTVQLVTTASLAEGEESPARIESSPKVFSEAQTLVMNIRALEMPVIGALSVDGKTAYIGWACPTPGMDKGGLHIVDVSDPSAPRLLKALNPGKFATAIVVQNGRAYVAWQRFAHSDALGSTGKSDPESFQIYDVANPRDPRLLGSFQVDHRIDHLAVSGNYAYFAIPHFTLKILDVSDPARPSCVGSMQVPSSINSIEARSSLLYLGCDGLKIVDAANPSAPKLIGQCELKGQSWGIALIGDTAYVATEYLRWYLGRVSVMDVSNPADPRQTDIFTSGKGAWGIAADGNVICVSGTDKFKLYDRGNKCRHVGTYDAKIGMGKVSLSGNRLYVGSPPGLQILDISDPEEPRLLGQHRLIPQEEIDKEQQKALELLSK